MTLNMFAWRASMAGLALLLGLAPGAGAQPLPGELEPWGRLDTPHFIFISQLDETSTLEMASDLERLHTVLAGLSPSGKLSSPNLTYIYLFRNYDAYAPFFLRQGGQPVEGVSYFIPHLYANYSALNADPAINPTRLLYSQYLHQLMAEQWPQIPLWFRQGVAEYYSTFEADAQEARIGLPPLQHVRTLIGQSISGGATPTDEAQRLFDLHRPTPVQPVDNALRERTFERQDFLARSWGAVHYLLNTPERRKQSVSFVGRILLGEDEDPAFSAAFDFSMEELQPRVDAYMKKGELPYLRVGIPTDPLQGALFRPLPPHEALFYLGDLILHSQPDRHADARAYFERTLAMTRSIGLEHGPSHAALGEVAELAGDMAAASRSYAAAVEHAGGDSRVQFLYGQSLLATLDKQRPTDDDGRERLGRAITALRESVDANPDFAQAWASLGFAHGLEDEASGDAIGALGKALELLPGRTDIALNLLLAQAKEGKRAEAKATVEALERMGANEYELTQARELLLQMDYRQATRLVRQKKQLDDAVALFARVEARTTNPGLKTMAAEGLEKFATYSEHKRFVALYFETESLLTREKYDPEAFQTKLRELDGMAKPGAQRDAVEELKVLFAKVETSG